MTTRLAVATRNAAANAVAAQADAGPAAATIDLRTGTQPATADDTATGTVLATFTLADPSFGASAVGVVTLASLPRSTTGLAAGTAGWFRMKDSTGATVLDGTAGTSGTELILNTTTISVGVTVLITSGTVTQPG